MNSDQNKSGIDGKSEDGVSRRDFLRTTTVVALALSGAQAAVANESKSEIKLSIPEFKPTLGNKKLRIGVVGGGFGLRFPWGLHPNCEVTAVADLFSDRREAMKQTFHCDNVYGEFHPMLKDPKVDAVALYTYGPDHAGQCIDIMNSGRHAMSVIPAAISLEDIRALIETAKSTGQIYMYGETGCFHPAAMAARKLAEARKFGHIYYTEGSYIHPAYNNAEEIQRYLYRDGKPTWRFGFPQGYYSGHAIGPIIHTIRERFVKVSAVGMEYQQAKFRHNQYGNPFVNTSFCYHTEKGNTAHAKVHWLGAAPYREGADIIGTEMCLLEAVENLPARIGRPYAQTVPLDLSPYREALPPALRPVQGHGGAHPHIINEFVSACLEHRKPFVDVYDAAAIAGAGIVGFQSALKDGETLDVPDFGSVA